jgi:hypothetical protein
MSSRIRTSLLTAAVSGAALASAAPALAAPTPLAIESAPTRVAAYDGTVMWSHFDAATNSYSLMRSVDGGAPAKVAVAPRSGTPFDIDLGTNRSGSTYAVYTRDGDIYRLNPATGSEVKITKLSSPTLAERDPTISRGDIAFIRRDHGYDQLRIGDTTRASKGSHFLVKRRSILSAELGVRHIAYITTGPGPISPTGTRTVRVRNVRTGADHAVYRAVSGGANFANVTRPTWAPEAGAFVWARTNLGSGAGNRIVRYTLRGSKLSYAQGSPFYNSTAWVDSALGVATASLLGGEETQGACTDAGTNYCQVALTGPVQFDRRP